MIGQTQHATVTLADIGLTTEDVYNLAIAASHLASIARGEGVPDDVRQMVAVYYPAVMRAADVLGALAWNGGAA